MTNKDGLSRRDFLKRSAALGGALVWVAPVVQVVGMRPAFAAPVSPGEVCDVFYAVKIEEGGVCVDIWNQTDPNDNQCLDVDDTGVVPIPGGCAFVTATNLTDPKKWLITLDPACEFQIGATMLKSGGGQGGGDPKCTADGISYDDGPNIVTFDHSADQDISNAQLVFCKIV